MDVVGCLARLPAQLAEARTRIEEIKTQLATLKAVKSGGTLAATLEKKHAELVAQVAKQTVELAQPPRPFVSIHSSAAAPPYVNIDGSLYAR